MMKITPFFRNFLLLYCSFLISFANCKESLTIEEETKNALNKLEKLEQCYQCIITASIDNEKLNTFFAENIISIYYQFYSFVRYNGFMSNERLVSERDPTLPGHGDNSSLIYEVFNAHKKEIMMIHQNATPDGYLLYRTDHSGLISGLMIWETNITRTLFHVSKRRIREIYEEHVNQKRFFTKEIVKEFNIELKKKGCSIFSRNDFLSYLNNHYSHLPFSKKKDYLQVIDQLLLGEIIDFKPNGEGVSLLLSYVCAEVKLRLYLKRIRHVLFIDQAEYIKNSKANIKKYLLNSAAAKDYWGGIILQKAK